MKQWWGPVGRPQHTALVIHPPFLSFSLLSIYMYTFFFNISLLIFNLVFFFLADESADEEVPRPQTKEEEDIDMHGSWMQVGGSCQS